jgi:hypothetical protein
MGLLWTPFPKGGLPSNRVSRCLLWLVWGEWLWRLAMLPCWELRVTDYIEGESGEASDG